VIDVRIAERSECELSSSGECRRLREAETGRRIQGARAITGTASAARLNPKWASACSVSRNVSKDPQASPTFLEHLHHHASRFDPFPSTTQSRYPAQTETARFTNLIPRHTTRNGSGQGNGRVRWQLSKTSKVVHLLTIRSVPQEFVKDGLQFVNRCTKPDKVCFARSPLIQHSR
jgi:hypothetical protein